jgi:hypothetical protein
MKAYELKIKYQDGKSKIFQQNFKNYFRGYPLLSKIKNGDQNYKKKQPT